MKTPAMFMQTMKNLFSNMLNSGVVVFLDDILMYSHMVDEHFTLLEKVLVHLHQYTFYYELKKCSFLWNSTMFLGFNVMLEGMHISDPKIWNSNEWPVPTIVK